VIDVASIEEEREELAAAMSNARQAVIEAVRENWPWLIVVYLVICGLALLVNWFVTGNIFS